jgi:hypothetical protein
MHLMDAEDIGPADAKTFRRESRRVTLTAVAAEEAVEPLS